MSGVGAAGFCAAATAVIVATTNAATRIAAVKMLVERRRNASVIIGSPWDSCRAPVF
jgi:hypothetical protein